MAVAAVLAERQPSAGAAGVTAGVSADSVAGVDADVGAGIGADQGGSAEAMSCHSYAIFEPDTDKHDAA